MSYDLYGIGNALVDFEYAVDDAFLAAVDLPKGRMTLVDDGRLDAIEASLQGRTHRRMSGGSAANTVFALQAFGGQAFYSCRVADDAIGSHFLDDLQGIGIGVAGLRPAGGSSGRCLTLVTADAERSMATCLGVSETFASEDLDAAALRSSKFLYVEGYLAARQAAVDAAVQAREVAEDEDVRTSLSLSDPAMVDSCRDGLVAMLGNGVHQLFCNEEEALAWAGTDRLDVAAAELRDIAPFVNITLGAAGSVVVAAEGMRTAKPFAAVAVDATGAGDIYAGAVIRATLQGAPALAAARFGNFAAAELVSRHGARLHLASDYLDLQARFRG